MIIIVHSNSWTNSTIESCQEKQCTRIVYGSNHWILFLIIIIIIIIRKLYYFVPKINKIKSILVFIIMKMSKKIVECSEFKLEIKPETSEQIFDLKSEDSETWARPILLDFIRLVAVLVYKIQKNSSPARGIPLFPVFSFSNSNFMNFLNNHVVRKFMISSGN